MKFDRSFLLMIVYSLFVLLYTFYITAHSLSFGPRKGDSFFYYLKFIVLASYTFFILQGLLLRTRNWGILLLLPLGVLLATIVIGYLLVGIIRWGGGDLLDSDRADMVLASILTLGLGFYALRFIKRGKKARR